jgi:hypothetical protein
MNEPYNPIVRTFCQIRAAILESGQAARHEIRPDSTLEELLPIECRKTVWQNLRRQGLSPPELELSDKIARRNLWMVLRATVSTALMLQRWSAFWLAIPIWVVTHLASYRHRVALPLGIRTIGELAICLTRFRDHKASGYRWTHSEIALKVRIIFAEQLGCDLDEVQLDSRIVDLTAC